MEKLGVILCSTVSRTNEMLEDENVEYLTLSTNFKDREIKSQEVNLEEYFKIVEKENEVPKTSQPSTGEIIDVINEAVKKYEKIIIVSINKQLSGTHQNIKLALSTFSEEVQGKIAIVNSQCIAMTETMIYDKIIEKKEQLNFEQLVEYLNDYAKRFVSYAIPGSMKYLKLSGRVNTSQLVLGTIVNIKTLIKVDSKNVSLYHKGRGYKSILKKIEEEIKLYRPKTAYFTSILEEDKIHNAIMELFAKYDINVKTTMEADIVSATHFGPNSFGFTLLSEK